MTKEQQIEKLHKKIQKCKKCSLWKTRANAVPGEGNIRAKIIFIGEAPGVEENKTGRPFCGRAGKLLDKLLKDAEIKREKVFITSCLKCRPVIGQRNRPPKAAEIKTCRKWWQKQIEIINPPKIVLLGGVAFDTVIGLGKLKDCRGRWLKIGTRLYLPTYHPAAAFRFPKIKEILKRNFEKIKL